MAHIWLWNLETLPKVYIYLLDSFERKILRWIFGPVREKGMWRIRYHELHREYNGIDLVLCIKFKRLQWAGHVQRLPLNHILQKAIKSEFTCSWPVWRFSFKWEESVKECAARLLWCHILMLTTQNRTVWWWKLWEAKGWLWAVVP